MTAKASSMAKCRQWRNELAMANPDPTPVYDMFKDIPPQPTYPTHVYTTTICCEKENCDKAKLESMPEHFFCDPDYIYFAATPYGVAPECYENGEAAAPPLDPYIQAYCPCLINRGQLVTICCVRRDCDDSTKIPGVGRERTRSPKSYNNNHHNNKHHNNHSNNGHNNHHNYKY
ncbi:uncharacterized protein LOC111360593 [Spodoptera litura]|uniref:Uncharacterized protein LOC111360593 n=1 Tax=Spodoptera litura TaxID=69820 RepID=A0A9J7EQK4_SPOLT|nr:uncharacterized protein LOC111360593 [Spodoptera litura]XP_022832338.1 uncharacterized protein LOC111360593 [Spodoptera litura]